MSLDRSRNQGYKAGIILLFVSSVVFIVGFVCPHWLNEDRRFVGYESHSGLWMGCYKFETRPGNSFTTCKALKFDQISDWLHVIRASEFLCLVGLVAACVYAIVTSCCHAVPARKPPHLLEVTAAVAGLLGFVGCLGYVLLHYDPKDGTSVGNSQHDFLWAFYLAAVGSGVSLIAAVVIAVSGKLARRTDLSIAMTTTPQSQHKLSDLYEICQGNGSYSLASGSPCTCHRSGADNGVFDPPLVQVGWPAVSHSYVTY